MELDNKNMILQPLLDNADLFSCAIEMATYLAMMQIGGPKKFFLWHVDAQQQGSGENIPSRFQKSLQHCYDDLELALWLMRAWFQSVSTHQERKKWAQEWEIDYELLTSVGNIRYQLLKDRLQNKKDGEVARPVDLRLIPKARLLLAHYILDCKRMPQETESVVMFRGDIARKQQQTVTIHRNSICYGREMDDFLYFSLNQWINDAHQVISITPEWLAWLEQKPRDSYDLAKYIVEETRYGTESVDIRKYEKERKPSTGSIHPRGSTFLGQKLTTLFAPFAVSAGENVIVEDYYKVCEIKNIPSEDGQPKIQWGKEYRGPITQIASLEHWAGVEILPAITGKLYLSDIPGNYNSITEVSFIHLKNEIPVKVKEIGKEIKLQALLQDANPLNEFKIGQRVRGIVTGTNKNTVFVGLHPHLYQAVCSVDRQYIQDISKHFSIGQVVTVLINDINYKTSRIYGRIIHHGEGMGGTA